jgi:DNA-directed RNA polymerase specialized sigma24 family protein
LSVDSGWTLSGAAFDRLLAMLADDRESAALAYGQLRTRTAGLMRWWGAADPETLADLALDRAARKLQEGAPVERGDFGAYVRGVARMVFYEAARVPTTIATEVEVVADEVVADPVPLDCLDECLDRLSPEDRRLVLRYYDGSNQIALRRELSRELGISPTALRIRTHRLRTRLEACVTDCVRRK